MNAQQESGCFISSPGNLMISPRSHFALPYAKKPRLRRSPSVRWWICLYCLWTEVCHTDRSRRTISNTILKSSWSHLLAEGVEIKDCIDHSALWQSTFPRGQGHYLFCVFLLHACRRSINSLGFSSRTYTSHPAEWFVDANFEYLIVEAMTSTGQCRWHASRIHPNRYNFGSAKFCSRWSQVRREELV